jgi:hypothetical protein
VNQKTALNIYLLFAVSWFLHLGARLPFLGVIRLDLLLVCVLVYLAFVNKGDASTSGTSTDKMLRALIVYSILTIPFVYWPGSVINSGLLNFIKGIVFYYFTIAFVRTETDLKKFVLVFVGCQLIRILEPLYLNLTEGYWGSIASMANWEYMYRLSGAPSDVVNPNGLAFIICTVLPFMYLTARLSRKGLVASLVLIPLCIYTLTLTGSRSGIVGLVIIFLGIIAKSERGVIWALPCVLLAVFSFPFLSSDLQDRYLSIIGLGEKNAETAEGRLTGLMGDIGVALHRPIFGHGLGTSREANANFAERDQPAHNLYAETAQELGFVGLILVILLLKSVYDGFRECKRVYDHQEVSIFLRRMLDAMQVLLFMNFIFSFASFGLSSYEWYLLGGFSVVMQRIAMETPGKSPASQRVKE